MKEHLARLWVDVLNIEDFLPSEGSPVPLKLTLWRVYVTIRIREQGGVSLTRLFLAFMTFGLSLPFCGYHRVRRTTIK